MRIYCVLVYMSVFSFCDIDSPLFRTNNAKEEHRSGHYFKRADYQWSSYPSGWWGSTSLVFTAVIPNISIILLPEYPVTFLQFLVSLELCFPAGGMFFFYFVTLVPSTKKPYGIFQLDCRLLQKISPVAKTSLWYLHVLFNKIIFPNKHHSYDFWSVNAN